MKTDLISIVLTLYNKAPYIEETIFSIYKQTYTNRELIIVDDCSTDGSFEIAKSFCEKLGITEKCKFIQNEKNFRVAKTFERGLKEAKGDWISMCDGDDILMKNKLETQLTICKEKNINFCFCEYILSDENNNVLSIIKRKRIEQYIFLNATYKIYLLWSNAVGSGIFFSRKIAKGLLDLKFPSTVYQDCRSVIGCYLLGEKVYWMHEKLFYYRKSNTSISNNLSQLSFYKTCVFMRWDIQNYILSFSKDKNIIHRIQKKNKIDALLMELFNGKGNIFMIVFYIIRSGLGFKYQMILIYQTLKIVFLGYKKKLFTCSN